MYTIRHLQTLPSNFNIEGKFDLRVATMIVLFLASLELYNFLIKMAYDPSITQKVIEFAKNIDNVSR